MSGPVEKKWRIKTQNKALCNKLAEHLNIEPVLAHLLLNRDITSLAQAQNFIAPSCPTGFPTEWIDAAARIFSALPKNATILLYGDYDVDGMTSSTIATSILRQLGYNVISHIPHRFNDGYGLNANALNLIHLHKPHLMMTLDCGITNTAECKLIKSECPDLPILILDHHQIPDPKPPVDLIINPKALEATSPVYELCTAGIVYLFFKDLLPKLNRNDIAVDAELDMVALGTIADVAILKDTNRHLTIQGLEAMNRSRRPGIAAILAEAEHDRPTISVRDIGFTIAPCLNAAGRLDHARPCVDLLLETDPIAAQTLAKKYVTLNTARKQKGYDMMAEIERHLAENPDYLDAPVLVLAGQNWHAGIIGIMASRLVEKYNKPTVIIGYDDEIGRGSARSLPGINIYDLLHACSDFFEKFGGHPQAAGFSIALDNIAPFCNALRLESQTAITEEQLIPIVDIDCKLTDTQLSLEFIEKLDRLAPFGHGNPDPVFYTNSLTAIDSRLVGNGSHLKVTFANADKSIIIDGIGFQLASKRQQLVGRAPELAFKLEKNTWRGTSKPQLMLIDIK